MCHLLNLWIAYCDNKNKKDIYVLVIVSGPTVITERTSWMQRFLYFSMIHSRVDSFLRFWCAPHELSSACLPISAVQPNISDSGQGNLLMMSSFEKNREGLITNRWGMRSNLTAISLRIAHWESRRSELIETAGKKTASIRVTGYSQSPYLLWMIRLF